MKRIPTRQLGRNGPIVGAIGIGTMGLSAFYGSWDEGEAFKALTHAADRGMTYWVTADIFGGSEKFIGKWFAETGRRSEIFLVTSFGCFDPEKPYHGPDPDSSPANIRKSLERSLRALGTDYIDQYVQGRVDPKVPIEIVLETLRDPVERGIVRWIGLSECSADVLRRARAVPGIGEKVVSAEREFSPFELEVEKDVFMQLAKETGVELIAYCPLGRGLATGRFRSKADFPEGDLRPMFPRYSDENFPKNLELVDKLKAVGEKYNVSASHIILAWMLAEHDHVIPIPGCRSAARVEENASAAELKLDPEDVGVIRALCENADVRGGRVPEQFNIPMDCIPLEDWNEE